MFRLSELQRRMLAEDVGNLISIIAEYAGHHSGNSTITAAIGNVRLDGESQDVFQLQVSIVRKKNLHMEKGDIVEFDVEAKKVGAERFMDSDGFVDMKIIDSWNKSRQ